VIAFPAVAAIVSRELTSAFSRGFADQRKLNRYLPSSDEPLGASLAVHLLRVCPDVTALPPEEAIASVHGRREEDQPCRADFAVRLSST